VLGSLGRIGLSTVNRIAALVPTEMVMIPFLSAPEPTWFMAPSG